jgi:biopolymer transport protein ExbB
MECSCAGIIRMLLMVLVFLLKDFSLYLRQLVKLLDTFMTKIQASIKQGEIDEAIVSCDKQQGSVKCN